MSEEGYDWPMAPGFPVPPRTGGPKRKIVQLCSSREGCNVGETLYALCDDGTVWRKTERCGSDVWIEVPGVPQK